jgi:hypothetical protein
MDERARVQVQRNPTGRKGRGNDPLLQAASMERERGAGIISLGGTSALIAVKPKRSVTVLF